MGRSRLGDLHAVLDKLLIRTSPEALQMASRGTESFWIACSLLVGQRGVLSYAGVLSCQGSRRPGLRNRNRRTRPDSAFVQRDDKVRQSVERDDNFQYRHAW